MVNRVQAFRQPASRKTREDEAAWVTWVLWITFLSSINLCMHRFATGLNRSTKPTEPTAVAGRHPFKLLKRLDAASGEMESDLATDLVIKL
jgi:hypothetical protein